MKKGNRRAVEQRKPVINMNRFPSVVTRSLRVEELQQGFGLAEVISSPDRLLRPKGIVDLTVQYITIDRSPASIMTLSVLAGMYYRLDPLHEGDLLQVNSPVINSFNRLFSIVFFSVYYGGSFRSSPVLRQQCGVCNIRHVHSWYDKSCIHG